MDCVIRKAEDRDAPAISLVVEAALRVSNARDYSVEIIDQVLQNFSPCAILRLLTLRQVYVASIDGRIVGTASLAQDTVRSVFVEPSYQGQGVGRSLLAHIESLAAQSGVERLRVPSSITAQGFYRSLGYVKVRDEFHGAERTIIMDKTPGR